MYNVEDRERGEKEIYRCDIWINMLGWPPPSNSYNQDFMCLFFLFFS